LLLSTDADDESNDDDDDDDEEMGSSTKLVAPRSDLRSDAEAEAPLRLRLPNPVILVGCDGDDEEDEDEEDESGCRLFGAAVTGSIFAADEAVVVRPRRMIPVPVQNQNHAAPL
jgi:hypothetical protein